MATSCTKKEGTPGPDDSAFRTQSELSDVVIVVEGRPLHVNRSVLSLISPVFLKMFNGEWKGKAEVPLADKKYDHFVELLLCVYPPHGKLISMETLDVVLPLADEYGIESLKLRCEAFVLARFQHRITKFNNPPTKELVHFLYLADKYKLKTLLEESVEKVILRPYDGKGGVKMLNEFGLLSVEVKYRITSERLCLLEKQQCPFSL
ncbi:BTB and MATH domain-containing protein 36-like [Haliotis rubra]|uniref:BTB and MATH domain-containing protein 36-like n=1 Tax=Haliotis rubra TaxID=36100 RepID=UPI001EE53209|nr:BTB and MATH domain-containing protein 36-like [Haliotis rubra]